MASDTLYAWSQTASDNATADATVNWAEFQTPSSVNDSARAMMKRIADYISDQTPAARTSTGLANAYAVTSDAAGATFRNGEAIAFIPHAANTTSCTLNVDDRGAKPWGPAPGVAFSEDNILEGVPVVAYYRALTDEWISPGTGYYVTAAASGVALQSITARLPQIGDLTISYAPTPGAGRIRLTEATQSVLKSSYPELNSYLSGISYPWGSTATHFSLPPAAGYFLRIAGTTATVDTGGPRTVGSTQSDQNKTATIPATGLTATTTISPASHDHGMNDGTFYNAVPSTSSTTVTPGAATLYVDTARKTETTALTAATTLGGSATLAGGTEVRTKNVAFHLDVVASTALAAAQLAVFGFPFQWDTGTSDATPGTGRVRVNNADVALATIIYISSTDGWGADIGPLLAGIADADVITLSKVGAQLTRAVLRVNGTVTTATGYYKIPVDVSLATGDFDGGTATSGDQFAFEHAVGGHDGVTVPDISGLTNLTEFDATSDEMIVYDTSAASHKALFLDAAKRYGAALDGSTDDTVALQALHDSGLVDAFYLPPGKTIRVDGPLNITRAGFKIVGNNKTYPGGTTTSSTIVTSSATNDVLRINANSVALHGVDIRGTGARSTSVNAAALQARAIVVGTTTRTVTDGAITLGDQTLTSATANFTASDVGCRIHIDGAYTGTSTPSITSINSTTSVEVSIAADVTVTGATTIIAPVYRDFTMEDCSVHSHAIGLHLYNSSNETVRFNQLHGFYAMKLECAVAADIGDRVFTGNEYNTSGAAGTKCIYHLSGGSPRFVGDKLQTAEIQYHMSWGAGTSGGPQFIGCIWENASNRHALFQDDGTGTKIIYHVIFDGNIFNGAPTAQVEFSDSGGTGWCKRVSVTGNIFATSSGTQLLVGKAVSSMVVDSNLFVGDGGETAIDIKSGAVNVNVMPGNVYDGVSTDITNASTTSSINNVKRAGAPLTLTNTTDTNSVQGLIVQGDRATPANADTVFQSFRLSNLSGTQTEMARITAGMSSGTAGAEAGSLTFSIVTGGALSNELFLNQAQLAPVSNDGLALGAGSTAWSDLYLASGGVLNFANGNWIATHTSGILTVGTGDLRVTTAGTNAASVVTVGGSQTLTSKTLTSPVINTGTAGTTFNPSSNDGAALGASGTAWSDLFLASGAVINWNAGDVTITHSSNSLAFAGASSGYSFDAAVTISGSNFNINATQPTFQFKDTSSTNADGKTVRVRHFQSGGQDYFRWDALDDAGGTANLIFDIQKTGININYVDIYNGAGTRIFRVNSSGVDVVGAGQMDSLRIDQAASTIGTGVKTISNAADSTTNFGKYFSINLNGTTVYVPCSTVAPT